MVSLETVIDIGAGIVGLVVLAWITDRVLDWAHRPSPILNRVPQPDGGVEKSNLQNFSSGFEPHACIESGGAKGSLNPAVIMTFVLSLVTALLWIPVSVTLSLGLIAVLIYAGVKFHQDNRDILIGVSGTRLKASALHGFFIFLPVFLLILPGIGASIIIDHWLGIGVDKLSGLAADKSKHILRPEYYDLPWYNPQGWVGIKGFRMVEDVHTMKAGLAIRLTVGAGKNFLNLLSGYTWIFIGYVTLRCYFYFWARVFLSNTGQVTMHLEKYRR